jgi:glycine/serine hydroxymethyltransferase
MKKLILGLVALGMFVAEIPAANAVVCARGVHRAGCVGPRGGAVVVRRPGVRCWWHRGVRVCR